MSSGAPKQETILVVDNEIFVRMTIAEYLRGCGYRVIECAGAEEALTILRHTEIEVDVVFSDVDMPGSMDGFALSRWIREHRPSLDVILTGSINRSANAAEELCNDGPLPKPYQAETVVNRIRRLMAARATRRK